MALPASLPTYRLSTLTINSECLRRDGVNVRLRSGATLMSALASATHTGDALGRMVWGAACNCFKLAWWDRRRCYALSRRQR